MASDALLPLFPLDLVLVPGELLKLHIFEPRYREMIGRAIEERTEFGIVHDSGDGPVPVGCAATVRRTVQRFDDGTFDIEVIGTRRFHVNSFDASQDCLQGAVEFFADDSPEQAHATKVRDMMESAAKVLQVAGGTPPEWEPNHPWLTFKVSADLGIGPTAKQRLIELRSEVERVDFLGSFLRAMIEYRERLRQRQQTVSGNGRIQH